MGHEILTEAARRVEAGERVALATVVGTRGSTPQKVSARLLVPAGGGPSGTLGGGGVEAEAIREARACLASGDVIVREYALSTGTDEWGLACGGTMVVFIEPLDRAALGWLGAVAAAGAEEPRALVTVLEGARAGARLIVRAGGVEKSSGDADLDREGTELGRRVLAGDGGTLASAAGVRVYAEAFGPAPSLLVVGAGHVGKALAGLGRFLGLYVTVVDDRSEYATRERFPEADEVLAAPVAAAIEGRRVTAGTAIVVAMRNQDLDLEAVAAAIRTPARYVGLIGSRRKAILVAERLLAAGVALERVREIRSPIGLDIGARTPEEIALSILSEWLMVREGGSAASLRLDETLLAKAAARAGAAVPAGPAAPGDARP